MDKLVTVDPGEGDSFQCFHLRQETLMSSWSEICGGRVWTAGGWRKNLEGSSSTSKMMGNKTDVKLKLQLDTKM